MSRSTIRTLATLFLVLLAGAAAAQPRTVILVRHAEKAAAPADDPELTAAGKERAELLARMLAHAKVSAIFSTQFIRTRKTVEPLSAKTGVPLTVIPAGQPEELRKRILAHNGETVVVVGHSNTVPSLIQALGGPQMANLDDLEYDRLFILSAPTGTPGSANRIPVLELRFGR